MGEAPTYFQVVVRDYGIWTDVGIFSSLERAKEVVGRRYQGEWKAAPNGGLWKLTGDSATETVSIEPFVLDEPVSGWDSADG